MNLLRGEVKNERLAEEKFVFVISSLGEEFFYCYTTEKKALKKKQID
jgi:hypothetical protein